MITADLIVCSGEIFPDLCSWMRVQGATNSIAGGATPSNTRVTEFYLRACPPCPSLLPQKMPRGRTLKHDDGLHE
eukprot:scaffold5596_cov132-Skeletonema_dohrnii-CCMP3373.AAC.1